MRKVSATIVVWERYEFDSQKEMNDWCTENMGRYEWEVYGFTSLNVCDLEKTVNLKY